MPLNNVIVLFLQGLANSGLRSLPDRTIGSGQDEQLTMYVAAEDGESGNSSSK